MDTWRSAIVDTGPTHFRVRGHDVLDLMTEASFTGPVSTMAYRRARTVNDDGHRRL
jgi:hypothetical protein